MVAKRAQRSDKYVPRPNSPLGPLQAIVLGMVVDKAMSVKDIVESLSTNHDQHVPETEVFNLVRRLAHRDFVEVSHQVKLPSTPGNKPRSFFRATELGKEARVKLGIINAPQRRDNFKGVDSL